MAAPFELAGFRGHPLDGAMLWFQPRTGLNLRWDAPATRALRRVAPRVVLFAITNRCNRACDFCSRDRAAPSMWTLDSAFETLADFARAGVLEVAFGGGEPLAFRGFDELIERLGRETELALHLTTNGELLSAPRAARLAPHLGEVRLSIYPEAPWAERAALLVRHGVVVGANVLVTPATLLELPVILRRLADLGCHDCAILRYVGHDATLHLSDAQERELAQLLLASPLRVRVSACFGDRLHPLPRLFAGVDGDCGAGRDFLVVTSDRRLKACSFQDDTLPFTTVADALASYDAQRQVLDAPAARPGCARPLPRTAPLPDGLRLWRGFSGNNSGDCVLVGRFGEPQAAEAFLAQLLPGYVSGKSIPQSWLELFAAHGLQAGECYPPDIMATLGRSLLMHTDSTLKDDFVPLRALLWKRGGRSVFSGAVLTSKVSLLSAIKLPEKAALPEAESLLQAAKHEPIGPHGKLLFSSALVGGPPGCKYSLDTRVAQVQDIAARLGGQAAGELINWDDAPAARVRLLQRRTKAGEAEWLWVSFKSAATAAAFAADLGPQSTGAEVAPAVLGSHVLLRFSRVSSRLGWLAGRQGGTALLLQGARLRLRFHLRRPAQQGEAAPGDSSVDSIERLRTTLRAFLAGQGASPEASIDLERSDKTWVRGSILSSAPEAALSALAQAVRAEGVEISWLRAEAAEPTAQAMNRLRNELAGQRED